MMTLYLAFEAVQNGQLSLNQKVRISRHAASQPPSKLYLKAGQRVSIRSLIRASAIKSANDAAVALAEAMAGSEKAFARLMTAKARQFGMTNTTFRNANGLTASGHLSTARDMAISGGTCSSISRNTTISSAARRTARRASVSGPPTGCSAPIAAPTGSRPATPARRGTIWSLRRIAAASGSSPRCLAENPHAGAMPGWCGF